MLPERPLLDVVNESNSAEVHIPLTLALDNVCLGNVGWIRGVWHGPFGGNLRGRGYGWRELCRSKNVREKRMVIQAPNAVGPRGLERIGQYQASNQLQIAMIVSDVITDSRSKPTAR